MDSSILMVIVLIPFMGTVLGSACVFLLRDRLNKRIEKILIGFAAGVMIAASIWSLLIPSMNASSEMGNLSFIPAAVGFILGISFLLVLDIVIPHLHVTSDKPEGVGTGLKKTTMLVFAVTLHNIPEGMAVGVALAGAYYGNAIITVTGAIALALGIAIQNFPEGAIISMPLKIEGLSKKKSFALGVLSGIVEPIGAILTFLLAAYSTPILPFILSFAAGAMFYVVIEELIPDSQSGEHTNFATISIALGFVLMMILDVALG